MNRGIRIAVVAAVLLAYVVLFAAVINAQDPPPPILLSQIANTPPRWDALAQAGIHPAICLSGSVRGDTVRFGAESVQVDAAAKCAFGSVRIKATPAGDRCFPSRADGMAFLASDEVLRIVMCAPGRAFLMLRNLRPRRAGGAPHMTKVFWLERTSLVRVTLRRFTFHSDKQCRKSSWGHEASAVIIPEAESVVWREEVRTKGEDGAEDRMSYRTRSDLVSRTDPRWPLTCKNCGEPFQLDDEWQVHVRELLRAPDGKLYTQDEAPIGAMWDAWWLPGWFRGPDGIALMVCTPGGVWHVDGQASNCTQPQQEKRPDGHTYLTERTHYCWIRHGDPRSGDIHVDKIGNTCAAGAGSIVAGKWHGFLHHGHLRPC